MSGGPQHEPQSGEQATAADGTSGAQAAESEPKAAEGAYESQAATEFMEPPREQIPGISKAHVAALESGNAEEFWTAAGMHHVILRTIGRRSGNEHKVALPYWRDLDGSRVVVASFAGAPEHPSWYLNLTDHDANAEVLVRVKEGSYWAEPELLSGQEYDRVWAALTNDRPFYNKYTERTTRTIPLVRLRELRPG